MLMDDNNLGQQNSQPVKSSSAISWSASEYLEHERSQMWYVYLVFGSVAISGLIYLMLRDILTSVAILVVAMATGFFSSRPPTSKQYELSLEGLKIDNKVYELDSFKSFSIVEEGAIDSIWLKPLGRFSPFLIIYFDPKDEEKIVDLLNKAIPYEQRELDTIDKVSRKLRL